MRGLVRRKFQETLMSSEQHRTTGTRRTTAKQGNQPKHHQQRQENQCNLRLQGNGLYPVKRLCTSRVMHIEKDEAKSEYTQGEASTLPKRKTQVKLHDEMRSLKRSERSEASTFSLHKLLSTVRKITLAAWRNHSQGLCVSMK